MYQDGTSGASAEILEARGGVDVDAVTARQVRIADLFAFRVNTGLRTSSAKHALIPPDCLSTEVKCVVTQTQAKNDYVLSPEELEHVTVRQNKKRRFYCPAELDAVSIQKFGFQKFLRKKFRSSAGVKTAEKNLVYLREREAKATHEECITAAKHAITFLTLKAQNVQAALNEAAKQFRADYPKEAEEFLPAPKANARLLKKEVQAVTNTLKAKYKEKLDKIKQSMKQAKKQARSKGSGRAKTNRAGRPVCKRCGSTSHVRSSKKQCPKYKPRPNAKGGKRGAKGVVTAKAVPTDANADLHAMAAMGGMMIPNATYMMHEAEAPPTKRKKGGKKGGRHPAL